MAKFIPGVAHTSELSYVFGLPSYWLPVTQDCALTREDLALAKSVGAMWRQFAATGDPNPNGAEGSGAVWPPYDAAAEKRLVLDLNGTRVERVALQAACTFWNQTAGNPTPPFGS